MPNTVCCMITLFHPTDKQINSVLGYASAFEKVFVFDNTPSSIDDGYIAKLLMHKKIVYLSSGENKGLSFAYNSTCKTANEEGFQFICLLDQDSDFKFQEIKKIVNFINYNDYSNLGIIAPAIKYTHDSRLDISNSWVISSGSFINLHVYSLSEGFDEKLFIDRIDFDYSMHIRELGYEIKVINSACLEQELGEQRSILGLSFFEHSPLRVYYMFRNRLYYYLTKRRGFKHFFICLLMSIKQIIRISFLERDKLTKIKMAFFGALDFKRCRYGAYSRKRSLPEKE